MSELKLFIFADQYNMDMVIVAAYDEEQARELLGFPVEQLSLYKTLPVSWINNPMIIL